MLSAPSLLHYRRKDQPPQRQQVRPEASNADTWNSCAALLNEALFQSMLTPLLTGDREPLMAKLTAYRDALEAHNAGAYVPVGLDETAQAFFDKIVVLNGCMDDDRLFAETLLTT